jgi:hypothetical protein
LRGKGHSGGKKAKNGKATAHRILLGPITEMLLLWTPAKAKWFPEKGNPPLSTPFERSKGEILRSPPQIFSIGESQL